VIIHARQSSVMGQGMEAEESWLISASDYWARVTECGDVVVFVCLQPKGNTGTQTRKVVMESEALKQKHFIQPASVLKRFRGIPNAM